MSINKPKENEILSIERLTIENVHVTTTTDAHADCPKCGSTLSAYDVGYGSSVNFECTKCRVDFELDVSDMDDDDNEDMEDIEVKKFANYNCLNAQSDGKKCGYCINCRIEEDKDVN